jgi:small subunit ribosomal protein S20
MPTTKSAKKRLRQNLKLRDSNRAVKSMLKTTVRKVRDAVAAKDMTAAETELRVASKRLDQAASKKIIHRNKASRTKSRLQHLIKTAKQAGAPS